MYARLVVVYNKRGPHPATDGCKRKKKRVLSHLVQHNSREVFLQIGFGSHLSDFDLHVFY